MNRVAYNSQTSIPDNAYDDVFDASSPSTNAAARLRADSSLRRNVRNVGGSDDENDNPRERLDPSPTGYRDYTPPAELLRNTQTGYYSHHHQQHQQQQHQQTNGPVASFGGGNDDKAHVVGSTYTSVIDDPRRKDEAFTHKTILLGDSGVGKTSLLVQFDTGQFQSGNFAATVGIGFTVMLLGDSGVGKTCLLTRFRDGRFLCGNFITTVGIDFRNKIVTVDNTRVKLQIWDTAGQERFRSITHAYYRDAHALLLLYDVTNKTSYDNIRAWLCEIREYAHDDVVIMLLGNKCDCGNERVVRKGDGERLAREHNVPFMETSAKTGLNVELAFFAVARHLKARKSEDPDKTKFNVQDYVRQQSQASNCFTSNCSTT